MHHIYRSNHLDTLAELLIAVQSHHDKAQTTDAMHLLKPLVIVVPSKGMGQWLKQRIAERTGIAANIDCILPSQWLWRLYDGNLSHVPKSTAFDKAPLTWRLMQTLSDTNTPLHTDVFALVRAYIEQTPQQLRYYQFAKTLANLFDKYLVYRPDLLTQWEFAGAEHFAASTAYAHIETEHSHSQAIHDPSAWQGALWQMAVAANREGAKPLHRLHWHQLFLHTLNTQTDRELIVPAHYFFGINSLPPTLVETIERVSEHCPLHSFVLSPCRQYWSDIYQRSAKTEAAPADALFDQHALLASWGKLGRDFFKTLETQNSQFTTNSDAIEPFALRPGNALLTQIQNSILDARTDMFEPTATDDHSLTFHRCYTPLREVEVLHDQILHLLDKPRDATAERISPRDIVVMMPNVEDYQPYIDAVFSQRHDDVPRLPYNISDRTAILDTDICQCFFQLLDLPQLQCTSVQVLEWLHIPAIQARFGIDASTLENIQHWLKDNAIYWGLSPAHQQHFGATLNKNHWCFGLNRLMSAYTMGHDADDTPVLYTAADNAQRTQLLSAPLHSFDKSHVHAKLWVFIDCLERYRIQLQKTHTMAQWLTLCHALLEDVFCTADDARDTVILSQLRTSIQELSDDVQSADYNEPLSADIIIDALTERLNTHRETAPFLSGGINFCSLVPLRALPFKAVFILGMNQNAYPRIDQPLSFDLMARHPRVGDRSQTHEDNYLFLEALMSAEQKLAIFWQGWDLHDNSEKAPSTLVTELRLFIKNHIGNDADDALSCRTYDHPLHAMDNGNFNADSATLLQSYHAQWHRSVPEALQSEPSAQAHALEANSSLLPAETINVEQLARFFNKPSRAFLKRLNIVFYEPDTLEETEPFTLATWQQKRLSADLLEHVIRQQPSTDYIDACAASGHYPYNIRDIASRTHDELATVGAALLPYFAQPHDRTVSYTYSYTDAQNQAQQLTVTQTIRCHNHALVGVLQSRLPSDSELLVQLNLWLNWLMLCAADMPLPLKLISINNNAASIKQLEPLARDEATFSLDRILSLYIISYQQPLALSAKQSYTVCEHLMKKVDESLHPDIHDVLHPQLADFEQKALETRSRTYTDTAENHLFPDGVLYDDAFVEQSKILWLAWVRHISQASDIPIPVQPTTESASNTQEYH